MRNQKTFNLFLGIIFIMFVGCEKLTEHEKFKRPDWLPGKLYTTVLAQEDLSKFAECLHLAGLDTVLDVSGSWTVFAPSNEAVEQYLLENNYASISNIPQKELERIAKFHVIQNPWTLEQLQSLSAYGWRTGSTSNNNAYAFKRETILKNPIEKYWFKKNGEKELIVIDSTISDGYKRVFVESRKYVPIFFDEYLNMNGISSEDYNFYFDRPYENGNVYFAGAKILRSDIFAENGFVHIIDKVVNPMLNARELLEREMPGESYKSFLEMVYWYYPTFSPNMDATFNQPAVRLGGIVDTLWNVDYFNLEFDLQRESTGPIGSNFNLTLVNHNGFLAPTDETFNEFIDNILTVKSGFSHWRDFKSLPKDVVDIIVAPNFKSIPIYPSTSQYGEIFRVNGRFHQNEGDIIRKEFGSNSTFIGINNYIPDRVFTSVTGPVFCRPAYSLFRRAMLYTGAHDVIARHKGELFFFPIPDYALNVDSSLILNWINIDDNRYNFMTWNRNMHQLENLGRSAIRNRILNQVGTSMPNGSASKEFIQTLGGNIITWDHSDNTIRGSYPCVENTTGNIVICSPVPLEEPADNGKSWFVKYWFNFRSNSMKTALSGYPKFYSLLTKAGFVKESSSDILFIDKNDKYTVFVPSDKALDSYKADTLSIVELRRFLKHHFIQGEMIFTDNKQSSGKYLTASGENLNIQTGPDIIEIPDSTGNPYVLIREKENTTNIMISEGSVVFSVMHEIDKVLIQK